MKKTVILFCSILLTFSANLQTILLDVDFQQGIPVNFTVIDDSLNSILPAGTYEAIPYVIIESNDNVPEHLLDALDSGYDEFSEKYFNYPIYRTGGKFIVTE